MTPEIRTALYSFAERVKHAYDDAFVGLVLFGSQARDDANGDSDIDVGVVLRTIEDRRAVRNRLVELAYGVLLETGEDIQAIAVSLNQWRAPETFSNPSLIQAMKQDGFASGGDSLFQSELLTNEDGIPLEAKPNVLTYFTIGLLQSMRSSAAV